LGIFFVVAYRSIPIGFNDIWNVLGVGRFAWLETSSFPQLANKNCIFVEVLPRFIHLGYRHQVTAFPCTPE
jgi:hypothetical protein